MQGVMSDGWTGVAALRRTDAVADGWFLYRRWWARVGGIDDAWLLLRGIGAGRVVQVMKHGSGCGYGLRFCT